MEFVSILSIVITSGALILTVILEVCLFSLNKRRSTIRLFLLRIHCLFDRHLSKRSSISSLVKNYLPLRWEDISFHDVDRGFPTLHIRLSNSGNEIVIIERAKFNIDMVGRLHNTVEGHALLFAEQWTYNIQFDPLFEGRSVIANLSTTILPHSEMLLSFTIGQETSDVATPTLYHFYLDLTDSKNRTIVSKPITVAIPSPIKARSYSMLDERPNVIKENEKVVRTFSSLFGYQNRQAQNILGNPPILHFHRFNDR